MDQLEGAIARKYSIGGNSGDRKCSIITEVSEEIERQESFSESYSGMSEPDLFENQSNVKDNLKKGWTSIDNLGFRSNSTEEKSEKPDILEVRKAFWARKNRFIFPSYMKRLLRKRKNNASENTDDHTGTRFGAVVSLAAMAAGMTSMPIVQNYPNNSGEEMEITENIPEEPSTELNPDDQKDSSFYISESDFDDNKEIKNVPEEPIPERKQSEFENVLEEPVCENQSELEHSEIRKDIYFYDSDKSESTQLEQTDKIKDGHFTEKLENIIVNKQKEAIENLNVEMKDDKIIVTKESLKSDIKPRKKLRKQTETVENLDNIMNLIPEEPVKEVISDEIRNFAEKLDFKLNKLILAQNQNDPKDKESFVNVQKNVEKSKKEKKAHSNSKSTRALVLKTDTETWL